MFTGFLGIGFLAGSFLFIGKFIVYRMIIGVFPKGLNKWLHRTPLAMVALDFAFAGLAAPVAGMAGGTIAMLTMITFGTLSAMYVGTVIVTNKISKKIHSVMPSRQLRYR